MENNKIETLLEGVFSTFNGFLKISLKNNTIQTIPLSAFNPTMQKLIQMFGLNDFDELKMNSDMIENLYLFNKNLDEISFIEENCLLKSFLAKGNGSLYLSSEVEYKLLSSIAAGKVNLSNFDLGIDFWGKCLKQYHMPLKYMVFKNVDFFFAKRWKRKIIISN